MITMIWSKSDQPIMILILPFSASTCIAMCCCGPIVPGICGSPDCWAAMKNVKSQWPEWNPTTQQWLWSSPLTWVVRQQQQIQLARWLGPSVAERRRHSKKPSFFSNFFTCMFLALFFVLAAVFSTIDITVAWALLNKRKHYYTVCSVVCALSILSPITHKSQMVS